MAIPWSKIRAEWLKGGTSYKKLGEKYGVNAGTIRNRASNEEWGKAKLQIADKVMTETRERVAHARVNHLEKLIAANEALLDGLVQMATAIQEDPAKNLFDKTGSLRNAESFAKAVAQAVATQRDLYRLPNIDQKFAAKKWKEQLKLEQKKQAGPDVETEIWKIVPPEGVELDE